MAFTVCYTRADGSTKCDQIPVAIPPWWYLLRPPIPPIDFGDIFKRIVLSDPAVLFGPGPHPWLNPQIFDERLTPELMQDLALLSTIHTISESLSPSIRGLLEEQLVNAIGQLPLPENMKVDI
jgi:hypothetical protein